jgi:hypothetical protein
MNNFTVPTCSRKWAQMVPMISILWVQSLYNILHFIVGGNI